MANLGLNRRQRSVAIGDQALEPPGMAGPVMANSDSFEDEIREEMDEFADFESMR